MRNENAEETESIKSRGDTGVAAQLGMTVWKIRDLNWALKEGKEGAGKVKKRKVKKRDARYSRGEKQISELR